jgi:hypothetical protein
MKLKVSKNIYEYCLVLGISLALSILFQIYWTNITVLNGVLYVQGGGLQRFFLKIFALSLIYVSLYKSFSVRALRYNLILKVPLIYYLATVVAVFPFTYSNAYIQSTNLVLFAPLLCLDFRGENGEAIFTKLVKIIVWVVCLQLVLNLVIKWFDLNLVATLLGGMGNANTFGLYLIVAALGLRFIYEQHLLSNIVLLLVWGTGSLACVVIASVFVFQGVIINLWKNTLGILFFVVSVAVGLLLWGENIFTGEFGPVWHAYLKVEGLINILFGSGVEEGGQFSGRWVYTMQGLQMLRENPLAIIFGHPNFLPFYSGDGFYVALLVTLGLPAMLLFIISNLIALYRGLREGTPLSNFAAYALFSLMLLFATNRILDYWPVGLVYMVVIAYLLRDRTASI